MEWYPRVTPSHSNPDHVHEVLSPDDVEAVSVHVYSSPLGAVRFREQLADSLVDA